VPGIPAPPASVVFDLDGTLLDSYAAIHECLSLVLAAFGRPAVTPAETRRMVGHGLEALVARAVGAENVPAGVKIFRDRYEVIGPESSTLLPGADAVTRRLVEAGIPMAIASNKPARFSREILEALGILSRFAFVGGPDSGFPPKPAPHMVFMALATMGAAGSGSVYVGDMPVDIATARAAGIPVIAVPSGSASAAELEAVSPDLLIRDLNELPGLLLS
jgi:phosphoglycolate phosphatase